MTVRRKRNRRSESILILGLGGVGFYLAKRLSHEGYEITIIESDPEKIRHADGEIDGRLIRGDALSFDTWREARAEGMDFLIAATDNDAVNLLACQIAERCGVKRKIARIRNVALWEPDALLKKADVHVDLVIRPFELTAREIARLLKMRSGEVVIDVGDGQMAVVAVEVKPGGDLDGATLRELAQRFEGFDFRVVAITRGIQTIVPGGDATLQANDHIFILGRADSLGPLTALAGVSANQRHRVMVVGGGLIGRRVAELLEGVYPVTLLERNEAKAEELSHLLKKTTVLCGDGSDAATLKQAGLLEMDEIVTATADNETNIMTSVLAKHLFQSRSGVDGAAGKTIALVYREQYQVLASTMGSDVVLNPKLLAGNRILKYVRRGRLLSVAHLHGCDAEVVEIVAEPGSPITRKPLMELNGMKDRIIIGGVHRGGRWLVAVGSTHIAAGDRVVCICGSQWLPDLQKLFRA